MIKKIIFLCLFSIFANAQNDLLNEIDKTEVDNSVGPAFKALKIVNLESTKMIAKKELWLIISHRFGYIENGLDDFFGLDAANTRIQMVYGITDKINVHAARDKFNKAYDMGIKYSIISQKNGGFPFTIVGFNTLAINTALTKDNFPKLTFKDRLAYVTQVLISKKINDRFSFQFAPTYVHDGFVDNDAQKNGQVAMGLGGRAKISKRVSFNVDYIANFNRARNSIYKDPFSVGLDIETGGHVFQLFFSNARASHENGFITNTPGDFFKGDISFGFNLTRAF